ncbi:MAG TPA: hypothetical protein VL402_03075 [Xanthobacteraceae bacterium]|nr:hypothetical protein [Xanthobacteraceae bacterium]
MSFLLGGMFVDKKIWLHKPVSAAFDKASIFTLARAAGRSAAARRGAILRDLRIFKKDQALRADARAN